MSVFQKLNTLFRAGARESAERLTEANAVRIYRQEIVDAENLLERRRLALAASIATRKDLEQEISTARKRTAKREQQIINIEPELRSEELLLLAAQDISATESHLASLQQRHIQLTARIDREELALRKLLSEIKEHRREAKILESQLASSTTGLKCDYRRTIAGQLANLRQTRDHLSHRVKDSDIDEASMGEAVERIEGDPLDTKLQSMCQDEKSRGVADALDRLRMLGCPA